MLCQFRGLVTGYSIPSITSPRTNIKIPLRQARLLLLPICLRTDYPSPHLVLINDRNQRLLILPRRLAFHPAAQRSLIRRLVLVFHGGEPRLVPGQSDKTVTPSRLAIAKHGPAESLTIARPLYPCPPSMTRAPLCRAQHPGRPSRQRVRCSTIRPAYDQRTRSTSLISARTTSRTYIVASDTLCR